MSSNDLVILTGDNKQAVTTSLKLASVFGRKHKNILASIRASIKINGNAGYTENEYRDSSGRMQTMYYVDRIGFVSLNITGHTEEKLKVIRAFNEAEGKIEESVPVEIVKESHRAEGAEPISTIEIAGKVITIYGSVENPLFKAKDVAEILGVRNHWDMSSRIDDEEKRDLDIPDAIGRLQTTTCLTEDGLYEACFQSRTEVAKNFKKKVKAILKELRSTGSVSVNPTTPMSTAQFLLQQAQFMVEQEQRLSKVEEKLEQMEQERVENGQLLLALDTSDSKPVPAITMRAKVNEIVNAYASANNVSQPDIFHYVYRELYYRYGVRVNAIKILAGETKLMALERNNHLPKVYDIVCHLPERLTN